MAQDINKVGISGEMLDADYFLASIGGKLRRFKKEDLLKALLLKTGGTMTGPINMDGNAIQNLPDAVNDGDALPFGQAGGLFAPMGYGLGGVGKPCSDCNTALESGFYSLSGSNLKNGPDKDNSLWFGNMIVANRNNDVITQTISYQNRFACRSIESGVPGEWEYLNPRMILGVEYRTTERYNGYVVYTQAFMVGQMSGTANTPVSIDISNLGIKAIVDWGGEVVDTVDNSIYALPYKTSSVEIWGRVTKDAASVMCSVGSNKNKVYMWIKYCKG